MFAKQEEIALMFDRKAWNKAYREKHKEELKAKRKIYLEKEETKEKVRASDKAWYEANKERTKEHKLAYMKAYRKDKKEIANANKAKRKAATLNRTPSWLTKEDLEEMKDIYRMASRRQEVEGIAYHVDHIIPMQGKIISGLHVPSNLQILKAKDNITKGNKYGED